MSDANKFAQWLDACFVCVGHVFGEKAGDAITGAVVEEFVELVPFKLVGVVCKAIGLALHERRIKVKLYNRVEDYLQSIPQEQRAAIAKVIGKSSADDVVKAKKTAKKLIKDNFKNFLDDIGEFNVDEYVNRYLDDTVKDKDAIRPYLVNLVEIFKDWCYENCYSRLSPQERRQTKVIEYMINTAVRSIGSNSGKPLQESETKEVKKVAQTIFSQINFTESELDASSVTNNPLLFIPRKCPECGYFGERLIVDKELHIVSCGACGNTYDVVFNLGPTVKKLIDDQTEILINNNERLSELIKELDGSNKAEYGRLRNMVGSIAAKQVTQELLLRDMSHYLVKSTGMTKNIKTSLKEQAKKFEDKLNEQAKLFEEGKDDVIGILESITERQYEDLMLLKSIKGNTSEVLNTVKVLSKNMEDFRGKVFENFSLVLKDTKELRSGNQKAREILDEILSCLKDFKGQEKEQGAVVGQCVCGLGTLKIDKKSRCVKCDFCGSKIPLDDVSIVEMPVIPKEKCTEILENTNDSLTLRLERGIITNYGEKTDCKKINASHVLRLKIEGSVLGTTAPYLQAAEVCGFKMDNVQVLVFDRSDVMFEGNICDLIKRSFINIKKVFFLDDLLNRGMPEWANKWNKTFNGKVKVELYDKNGKIESR